MAKPRHSEFKSIGKTGKGIDAFVWTLIPLQFILLAIKLFDDHTYSWWVAFIPLFILCVPLLLIAFGVSQAGGSKR